MANASNDRSNNNRKRHSTPPPTHKAIPLNDTRREQRADRTGAGAERRERPERQKYTPPSRGTDKAGSEDFSGAGSFSSTLGNIDKANRQYAQREWAQTHVKEPLGRALRAPGQALYKQVEEGEDAEGYRYAKDKAQTAYDMLANPGDRSRITSLKLKQNRLEGYALAGDKIDAIAGRTITDAEQLTMGDIRAFEAAEKNPRLSIEALHEIRDRVNGKAVSGGKIDYNRLGHTNRLYRRAQRAARASRMNAAEQYAENLIRNQLHLFTPKEQEILKAENSVFRVKGAADFKARDELINKVLSQESLFGESAKLDWSKMTSRDISNILKGQGPVKPVNDIQRGLIEMKLQIHENYRVAQKLRSNIARRKGPGKTVLSKAVIDPLMQDPTIQTTTQIVSGTTQGLKYAVKGAAGAVDVTAYAAAGLAKGGLKGTAALLEASGKQNAAEKLRHGVDRINKTQEAVKNAKESVKEAPRRAGQKIVEGAAHATATVISAIGRTRAAQYLVNTKAFRAMSKVGRGIAAVGRGLGHGIGSLLHFLASPLRLLSVAMGALRAVLMKFAAGIGVILLVEIVIVLLTSSMGGSSGAVAGTIMDTEEHFADFQQRYDEDDAAFQAQIEGIVNGVSQTLNKKGASVQYGVLGAGNAEGAESSDFVSGVTMSYDGAVSSNLEDILSVMAVIMQQDMQRNHEAAMELLDALYKSTHTYSYTESPLYPCESGCETTTYHCNEWQINYPESDLRFAPWLMEDVVKPTEEQECVVCREAGDIPYDQYAGCTVTGTCYHEDLGRSDSGCDNASPVYSCPGHDSYGTAADGSTTVSTSYCSGPLGCEGYYECQGHDHYGCPDGHEVKACYGHVNIDMHVNIATMDQIFEMGGVQVFENGEAPWLDDLESQEAAEEEPTVPEEGGDD